MTTDAEFLLWSVIDYTEIACAGFHFQHNVQNVQSQQEVAEIGSQS